MRWTRQTTRTVIKLGIFAVVCVLFAGWLVIRIGNIQLFNHDVGYRAELADASGLGSGDAVKISGVTVGRVDSVGVQRGYAVVSFGLVPTVRLHSSSGVGLQWLDVLGDKVLYLYPSSGGPLLKPGGTLPLSSDIGDASIGALLNALGPFLQAIDPKEANSFLDAIAEALQGNDAEVHSLLDHTASVAGTLGSVSAQFGNLIDNLGTVVTAVARHRGDVASLTVHLASLSGTLKSNNGVLDSTVSNLSAAEKDLASLLSHNSGNLDSIISNLKGIAGVLDAHRGALATSLHTLPAGLAPYEQISSYGQWFEIDPVFTCLANETVCSYQSPTDAPGGSTNPAPGGTSSTGAGDLGSYFSSLGGGGS